MGVFDNIFDKARDAADVATRKTGDVVEKSKIKLRIVRIQNEIKDKYTELGKCYYQTKRYRYDHSIVIDSLVEEIKELFAQMEEANSKLAEISNLLICNCCSAKNPEDSLYCSKCGNKLVNTFDGYDDIVDDVDDLIQEEENQIYITQETLKKEAADQGVIINKEETEKTEQASVKADKKPKKAGNEGKK